MDIKEILEKIKYQQLDETFNNPERKGSLTINGFSFDVRIVKGLVYCAGIRLPDFLFELDLPEKETEEYFNTIAKWVME